jgi:uridine kinase
MVIGISGGSGSGKTTFSISLAQALSPENCLLISQDAYYHDNSLIPFEERQYINFDHPSTIDFDLLVEQLKALKHGQDVMLPTYSFLTCERGNEKVYIEARPIIILEGIFIFYNKILRDLLDVKVFLSASADERLSRISPRDQAERGRSLEQVRERFYNVVDPMHRQFVEPLRIFADIDIEHVHTDACVEEVLWFMNQEQS